jgi:hypothetical protein
MKAKLFLCAVLAALSSPALACGGFPSQLPEHIRGVHAVIDQKLSAPGELPAATLLRARELRGQSEEKYRQGMALDRRDRQTPSLLFAANSAGDEALKLLGLSEMRMKGPLFRC